MASLYSCAKGKTAETGRSDTTQGDLDPVIYASAADRIAAAGARSDMRDTRGTSSVARSDKISA